VSNPIRYDSLLVRHLARELDDRFRGVRASAIRLDPDTRVASIELEDTALEFDLHPTRGWISIGAPRPAARVIPLKRRSVIASVTAPPDERRLEIRLGGTGDGSERPRAVIVELMTNQWNTVVLGDGDRILAVLWSRSAGDRNLRVGARYEPPAPSGRAGVDGALDWDDWVALLGDVPAEDRGRRLVSAVAWTSPLNAGAILGGGDLRGAYERYGSLVADDTPRPAVVTTAEGTAPYPFPLPGFDSTPCASMLEAIARACGATAAESTGAVVPGMSPELIAAVERRIGRLENRARRLREERDGAAPAAARLRSHADLLLTNLHSVRRGDTRAELQDFSGDTVVIELDPALSPIENAERLYETARKRERAARALPPLIESVEREIASLRELIRQAEIGEASADQIRQAAGLGEEQGSGSRAGAPKMRPGGPATPALPYRVFRTTGGFEVRVGRSGRDNDELTFRHSSPNDVWLHARDSTGAHVILRWPHRDENPPAQALREAAVLAALHSQARTSGLIPVDWTRRKYVRKPRKAPPGKVVIERARTVFVEPDPSLAERLRAPG